MERMYSFTPILARDIANLFLCAEEYLKSIGLFLPKAPKISPTFWINNSSLFLKNENIMKIQEGYSIPLIFAKAYLLLKGFDDISDIFDSDWVIITAYNLMTDTFKSQYLLPNKQIPILENLIEKERNSYILPKTVLPGLLQYARKFVRTSQGNAMKFSKKTYITDPLNLAYDVIQNYELRKCKICGKYCTELLVSECCEKPFHWKCAENMICPRKCTQKYLELKYANSWKQIFVRKPQIIERLQQELPENIKKPAPIQFEDIKEKSETKSKNVIESIFINFVKFL